MLFKQVIDVQRQHAKQICYGIIYGMGARTLSEQLEVEEEVAIEFMETFHRKYPGIKKYIQKVVQNAKLVEYVETVTGRRRYLPNINCENPADRSEFGHQAVENRSRVAVVHMQCMFVFLFIFCLSCNMNYYDSMNC